MHGGMAKIAKPRSKPSLAFPGEIRLKMVDPIVTALVLAGEVRVKLVDLIVVAWVPTIAHNQQLMQASMPTHVSTPSARMSRHVKVWAWTNARMESANQFNHLHRPG